MLVMLKAGITRGILQDHSLESSSGDPIRPADAASVYINYSHAEIHQMSPFAKKSGQGHRHAYGGDFIMCDLANPYWSLVTNQSYVDHSPLKFIRWGNQILPFSYVR